MDIENDDSKLYKWLNDNPEIKDILMRIHDTATDEAKLDFNKTERDLIEQTRALGKAGLEHLLQSKEAQITFDYKQKQGGRIQGKKN